MLLDGHRDKSARPTDGVMYEDQVYLSSLSGTMRLDKFTHCLLVKCSTEVSALRSPLSAARSLGGKRSFSTQRLFSAARSISERLDV